DYLAGLNLSPVKTHALIDFISILPEALQKACTVGNVRHGFIANGTIDRHGMRYPSWNGILATCKRNIHVDEYERIFDTFPAYLKKFEEEGYADEDFHDNQGAVERDTNSRGEEVLRTAGITQEHMQRAKCLNHSFVCEQRNAEAKKHQRGKLEKMRLANSKHQEKVELNRDAVSILVKTMENEGLIQEGSTHDESLLERCPLECFDKLLLAQLKAFIIAHDENLQKISDIPCRGKLKDAMERRNDDGKPVNAILMAYRCRDKPNILVGKEPFSQAEIDKVSDGSDAPDPVLTEMVVRLGEDRTIDPSRLLKDPLWRSNAIRLFHLDEIGISPHDEPSAEMKTKADQLAKLLRGRFKRHLKQRIKQRSRRTHWSMKMAYKNLTIVAALMVLQGHTKDDLQSLMESDSLLPCTAEGFVECNVHPNREGTYLYFDTNRGVFVRSGKVVGRGFGVRNDEHEKCAEAHAATSLFYRLFPSLFSPRASKKGKKGVFESLIQLVAAGFDRDHEVAHLLDKDVSEGGILLLSKEDKDRVKASMSNLKCNKITKFHHILAYQIELGYDLALSPDNNVSQSPDLGDPFVLPVQRIEIGRPGARETRGNEVLSAERDGHDVRREYDTAARRSSLDVDGRDARRAQYTTDARRSSSAQRDGSEERRWIGMGATLVEHTTRRVRGASVDRFVVGYGWGRVQYTTDARRSSSARQDGSEVPRSRGTVGRLHYPLERV
ncbi:hypothetical protein ACHAWF_009011, partial [Thalassiosira exigua]